MNCTNAKPFDNLQIGIKVRTKGRRRVYFFEQETILDDGKNKISYDNTVSKEPQKEDF